jgi:hypothetical protein
MNLLFSGFRQRLFSTIVIEMVILVISKLGHVEEKRYTKRDNPDEMKALSVNLGALGFVYLFFIFVSRTRLLNLEPKNFFFLTHITYSVTYEVADMFNLKAVDERFPWPEDPKVLEKYLHDLGTCLTPQYFIQYKIIIYTFIPTNM